MSIISDLIGLIRTATLGKDVRNALADSLENISNRQGVIDSNESIRQTNESQRESNELSRDEADTQRTIDVNAIKDAYDAATRANTNIELTNARRDNANNINYDTLGQRLDSASEILTDHASQLLSLASGGPKGVFSTLGLLQGDSNANTVDGRKCIYVVSSDNNWYYWNDSNWVSGGAFLITLASGLIINDPGNLFISSNVEDALQEVKKDTVSITSGSIIKSILSNVGCYKLDGSSHTLSTASQYVNSNLIGIRFNVTVNGNGYVYACAKIENGALYDIIKTKKMRFVIRGRANDISFEFKLTNGQAWGSADNTVGTARTINITLNSDNNYTKIIDINLSDSDIEAFFGESQRSNNVYQTLYGILALNNTVDTADGIYELDMYAYELLDNKEVQTMYSPIKDISNYALKALNATSAATATSATTATSALSLSGFDKNDYLTKSQYNTDKEVIVTGKQLTLYTYAGGNVTGITAFTVTTNGLTKTVTRPEAQNTELVWNYTMMALYLGTFSEIQNKSFYIHFDKTNCNLPFNATPKLTKSYSNWSTAISIQNYDFTKYYNIYDVYDAILSDGRWAADDPVFLMFWQEYPANSGPTTIPSIDIDIHGVSVKKIISTTDTSDSFVLADFVNRATDADRATLADRATIADTAVNADRATYVGYLPFNTEGLSRVEGGSTSSLTNNNLNMSYAVGQTSSTVVISRYKLGKVGDLKDTTLYLKAKNLNTDVATDISGSYRWIITFLNNTQWGETKWNKPIPETYTGSTISGLYEIFMAMSGVTEETPIYLAMCNMGAYYSQSPYSLDITGFAAINNPNSDVIASSLKGFSISEYNNIRDSVNNSEISNPTKIVCWGDSLTAGGGWTNQLQTLSGLTVYNGGTGGENVRTIVARQGADVMLINDVTIPAETTPVTLKAYTDGGFDTFLGYKATPLLQGGAHVNPVKIGDIEGTLTWTGSSYNDSSGVWTFTRTTAGSETVINRPTAIRTDFDRNKNDGIMIVFIGQNGGYTDDADLINMHKLMKTHSKSKNMIVLGLSSGSASSRSAYEASMRKEFGRYFISLREYLSTYGLSDAGLTPTQADTDAMATGTVPPQLLADSVHYTTTCKTVIGNMLYKKMRELNIL